MGALFSRVSLLTSPSLATLSPDIILAASTTLSGPRVKRLLQPTEPDYDSYLGKLQTQIAARQARLQQIRLRERRANALFITYGLGLWILYTLLWWFGMHGGSSYASWETKALRTAPVVLSPVACVFGPRLFPLTSPLDPC